MPKRGPVGSKPPQPWISATATISALVAAMVLSAGLVYFLGDRSLFVETPIILGLISMFLFVFLFVGLYKDIRLIADLPSPRDWKGVELTDISSGSLDTSGFSDSGSEGGGLLEALLAPILSFVIWLVASIVITLLGWLLINVVLGMVFMLVILIFWVFYHALQLVFRHAGDCRGNLGKSLWVSGWHTVLFTGWTFLVVSLIRARA